MSRTTGLSAVVEIRAVWHRGRISPKSPEVLGRECEKWFWLLLQEFRRSLLHRCKLTFALVQPHLAPMQEDIFGTLAPEAKTTFRSLSLLSTFGEIWPLPGCPDVERS